MRESKKDASPFVYVEFKKNLRESIEALCVA